MICLELNRNTHGIFIHHVFCSNLNFSRSLAEISFIISVELVPHWCWSKWAYFLLAPRILQGSPSFKNISKIRRLPPFHSFVIKILSKKYTNKNCDQIVLTEWRVLFNIGHTFVFEILTLCSCKANRLIYISIHCWRIFPQFRGYFESTKDHEKFIKQKNRRFMYSRLKWAFPNRFVPICMYFSSKFNDLD